MFYLALFATWVAVNPVNLYYFAAPMTRFYLWNALSLPIVLFWKIDMLSSRPKLAMQGQFGVQSLLWSKIIAIHGDPKASCLKLFS